MRILIIENEIYLAQSIASKLGSFGFECEIISLVSEGLSGKEYDVVLLSTNLIEQNIYPIINAYKNSIIILLISYVSDDTVTKPLKAGAKDYILKPFAIDDLARKIEHYHTFQYLKQITSFYYDYIDSILGDFAIETPSKISLPLVLQSQNQKSIDAYIIAYAKSKHYPLSFISLKGKIDWREAIQQQYKHILYIVGLEELKKPERKELLNIITAKQAVVSYVGADDIPFDNIIKIDCTKTIDFCGEILCIDDYIKNIILRFEHKYPDTELSRKLGISRKSLWEKRKKYGIIKKK